MSTVQVEQWITGTLMREGAGVKLHRYIGADRQNNFDPILLFDVFNSEDPMDYIGGFPAHPHRGFETVTYLLHGQIEHTDNHGHHGLIQSGDVQWMTAGRGIIHSEMPKQSSGRLSGLQVWFNLPATDKLCEPRYQEFNAGQLPLEQDASGLRVKVIAGKTAKGTQSPLHDIVTQPLFLDIQMPRDIEFNQTLLVTHQSLLFTCEGEVAIITSNGEEQVVKKGMLVGLSQGDSLTLKGKSDENQCLLIAAKKLNEPVERLGPFVMNTHDEIMQAIDDFRNNRF